MFFFFFFFNDTATTEIYTLSLHDALPISISGLHLTVPAATRMHGISVLGHEVTLSGLAIDGAPLTDVRIGAGAKGSGGMSGRVELTDSALSGGQRDVVSICGAVGLR